MANIVDLETKYNELYEEKGYDDYLPSGLSSEGVVLAEAIMDLYTGFCDHINYMFSEDDDMVTDAQTFEIFLNRLSKLKPTHDDSIINTKTGKFIVDTLDKLFGGELDLCDEDLEPIMQIKELLTT